MINIYTVIKGSTQVFWLIYVLIPFPSIFCVYGPPLWEVSSWSLTFCQTYRVTSARTQTAKCMSCQEGGHVTSKKTSDSSGTQSSFGFWSFSVHIRLPLSGTTFLLTYDTVVISHSSKLLSKLLPLLLPFLSYSNPLKDIR